MAVKKYLDYTGLTELVAKIKTSYGKAFQWKGSVANVAALPAVADLDTDDVGSVYNVIAESTTTSDFVEGAGKVLPAYSNVVLTNVGTEASPSLKWDVIGVFDISGKLSWSTTMPSSPSDGDIVMYLGDSTYTYAAYSGTLTADSNPYELGLWETDGTDYTLTTDTEPATVYKAWGTGDYYTEDDEPSVGDTVYTISGGAATDSGYTVTAYDATNGITVNGTDYARDSSNDTYISTKTYYTGTIVYQQGAIYQYDTSTTSWVCLAAPGSGSEDTYTAITTAEVDALFD